MTERADAIAAKIEAFVRTEVIPYEKDPRAGSHGPSDELVMELRDKARKAGVLTPHILPDGSHFAIADPRGMGDTSRSIGFLVADLDEAIAELRGRGVEVGEPAANDRHRYVHFRAPDGKLYELVAER